MAFLHTVCFIAATITMLIIIVIIIFLCNFTALNIIWEITGQHVKYPYARISDIYDSLKTGDIIVFVHNVRYPFEPRMSAARFGHPTMVIEDKKGLYITEANAGGYDEYRNDCIRYRSGGNVNPLLPKLKFYDGRYYVYRLSDKLTPVMKAKLLEEVYRCNESTYPTFMEMLKSIPGNKHAARQCFEHAEHLLETIGFRPFKGTRTIYELVYAMCRLHEIDLHDTYYYEPPVEIIYDVGCITF